MRDTLGTIFGFILGLSLLFIGIVTPDKYSNYYVYMVTSYEQQITKMEIARRPMAEIRLVKKELEDFKVLFDKKINIKFFFLTIHYRLYRLE